MSRVKRGVIHTKKRKKILRLAKGYRGGRSKLFTQAAEALKKSLSTSYRDRRRKKRDFRKLWIIRINAAVREQGLSYSQFVKGMREASINLNRKVLSDLAIRHPEEFTHLVEKVKENLKR
ncbi:50S ribosomal protein L20 [Patescibacteria group bacterium]|nr:50S ribosomal protein L20 [Patescibacteria group bacterium]